jgi:hypothetical protein
MEVDADAAAICREDPCGKVGNGEGGGGHWARRSGLGIEAGHCGMFTLKSSRLANLYLAHTMV